MRQRYHTCSIVLDLVVVALSVYLAYAALRYAWFDALLGYLGMYRLIGIFVAGVCFVSVFTIAPATVALVEFASHGLWETALVGALGSLVGDYIIFRFMRDNISRHLVALARRLSVLRSGSGQAAAWGRATLSFLGAVIVILPFPDEIGLALMGLSQMRTIYFLPLSFALNFLGILFIALASGFLSR